MNNIFMNFRQRTLYALVGLLVLTLLQPANLTYAAEDNPYLPPGGTEWNKLRDLTITDYGWGYGSTVTDNVYQDQNAKQITVTDWWAAQFTTNGWQTFDFTHYYENGSLEFDIAGMNGGEQFRIGFRDAVHERVIDGIFYMDEDDHPEETNEDALSPDVNEYTPVSTEWQHVSIPLKDIFDSNPVFDPSKAQLLKLTGLSNEPMTIWISNIKVVSPDKEPAAAPIKVNQVGYLLYGEKYALVSGYYNELDANIGTGFEVKRSDSDEVAYSGTLTLVKSYDHLSGEKVLKADFTALSEPGQYYIVVENVDLPSVSFEIGDNVYDELLKDVQKFFYYQRANVDLDAQHAGVFAREGLRKEDSNLPLQSNPDLVKDVSGGWWDAGDLGKYVTAGSTAVSDLLWAYESYPHLFTDGQLNIPESGNGVPDLLDEIKVETDFFLKMQDIETGGFYSYVIRENVPNRFIMDGTDDSSIIPTAQTANTVGALAHASIVFSAVEGMEEYGNSLLLAALNGWNYLASHPEYIAQPDGPYNDDYDLNDRFYAAAALYRATGEKEFNDYVKEHYLAFEEKFDTTDFSHGINGMEMIGYYHYASAPEADEAVISWFTDQFITWREQAIDTTLNQATWRNATNEGFYWGANSNVASMPMSIAIGSRIIGDFNEDIITFAAGNLNYLLGINPLHLSYITGHGEHRIHITHHEIYMRDFIVEMPNGYMVGGPNNWKATFPAKAYNHATIDWETNEQALNYNSPLTYLTAMLTDYKPVSHIHLSKTSDTIAQGESSVIEASVEPSHATVKTVNISSTNENVATVSSIVYNKQSGKTTFSVYGKGAGTAQIIITSRDERASASFHITVEEQSEATPEPTITPSETPTVTLPTATPDPTIKPSETPTATLPPATPDPTIKPSEMPTATLPPATPDPTIKPSETPTATLPLATPEPSLLQFNSNIADSKRIYDRLEQLLDKSKSEPKQAPIDTVGHWAQNILHVFYQLDIIKGYNNGQLKPNEAISRAEFISLLQRAFNIPYSSNTVEFKDTEGHWASNSIQAFANRGIINGYADGTFKPDQSISREEMITIITRIVSLQVNSQQDNSLTFIDLADANAFAAQAIQDAANAGIIQGDLQGAFHPQASCTRAEALQVIWNTLSLDPSIKQLLHSM